MSGQRGNEARRGDGGRAELYHQLNEVRQEQAGQREAYKGVSNRLDRVEGLIERLGRHFDDNFARLESMARRPTNWGWLVAAGALFLAGNQWIFDMQQGPIRADLVDLRQESKTHREAWMKMLATHFDDEDAESMEARLMLQIDRNREALSEHMANGHPHTVIDKIDALSKRVDENRDELQRRGSWMTDTTVDLAESDASFEARLADLEREIREISAEQRRRTERVYE